MAGLDVAASLTGLVSAGVKLSTTLYTYCSAVARADDDITALASDTSLACSILDVVSEELWKPANQTNVTKEAARLCAQQHLDRCKDIFDELQDIVGKQSRKRSNGKLSMSLLAKACWPLKGPHLEQMKARLESLKIGLLLLVNVLLLSCQRSPQLRLEHVPRSSNHDWERFPSFLGASDCQLRETEAVGLCCQHALHFLNDRLHIYQTEDSVSSDWTFTLQERYISLDRRVDFTIARLDYGDGSQRPILMPPPETASYVNDPVCQCTLCVVAHRFGVQPGPRIGSSISSGTQNQHSSPLASIVPPIPSQNDVVTELLAKWTNASAALSRPEEVSSRTTVHLLHIYRYSTSNQVTSDDRSFSNSRSVVSYSRDVRRRLYIPR